jgi:hypothetical protein
MVQTLLNIRSQFVARRWQGCNTRGALEWTVVLEVKEIKPVPAYPPLLIDRADFCAAMSPEIPRKSET